MNAQSRTPQSWITISLLVLPEGSPTCQFRSNASDGGGGRDKYRFDLLDDVISLKYLPEHNMFSIKMTGWSSGDEELRPVGVLPCIGHGEQAMLAVLDLEVLVVELLAVDRLSSCIHDQTTNDPDTQRLTCPIVIGEVSSLQPDLVSPADRREKGREIHLTHELGDDAMECRALVVQLLPALADTTLPWCET